MQQPSAQRRFSAVVLTTDDPFAALLLAAVQQSKLLELQQVFLDSKLMGNQGPLEVLVKCWRQAGWRYTAYQSVELLAYKMLLQLTALLRPTGLALPSMFCRRRNIPMARLDQEQLELNLRQIERADYLICFRYGAILPKAILDWPKIAALNFHGSLLPKYAGLGSIFQALRHNEPWIGGTYHRMSENLDQGPILAQTKIAVEPGQSVSRHHLRVYLAAAPLIDVAIANQQQARLTPQNPAIGSYFSFPTKDQVRESRAPLFVPDDLLAAAKTFFSWRA